MNILYEIICIFIQSLYLKSLMYVECGIQKLTSNKLQINENLKKQKEFFKKLMIKF